MSSDLVMDCHDERDRLVPPQEMLETRRAYLSAVAWKYRPFRDQLYFASPQVQFALATVIALLCAGSWDAAYALSLITMYSGVDYYIRVSTYIFVSCLFAGAVTSKLGTRISIAIGGFGISIHILIVLAHQLAEVSSHHGLDFILGISSVIFSTAQIRIALSYPSEASKGRFIFCYQAVPYSAGLIGTLLYMTMPDYFDTDMTWKTSRWFLFGLFICCLSGACLAWLPVDTKFVVRTDGSRFLLMKRPTWKSELLGLRDMIFLDRYAICLFPLALANGWFNSYLYHRIGTGFNERTTGIFNVVFSVGRVIGPAFYGFALDVHRIRRRLRAISAWMTLSVFTFALYASAYVYEQRQVPEPSPPWISSSSVILFLSHGIYDGAWVTFTWWLVGALSNDGRKLGYLVGASLGLFSLGAAMNEATCFTGRENNLGITSLITGWVLALLSLVTTLPMILRRIKDTTPVQDDLQSLDQTIDDVIPRLNTSMVNSGGLEHDETWPRVMSWQLQDPMSLETHVMLVDEPQDHIGPGIRLRDLNIDVVHEASSLSMGTSLQP